MYAEWPRCAASQVVLCFASHSSPDDNRISVLASFRLQCRSHPGHGARALPRPVFDFADGGAEDERTLRRNEAAFGDVALLPRPLNGAAKRDLSITLFGQRLAMPLDHRADRSGRAVLAGRRIAAARAPRPAGTAYCASHGSACTLEDIAATGAGPRWMQVFVYSDRGFTREMIDARRGSRL